MVAFAVPPAAATEIEGALEASERAEHEAYATGWSFYVDNDYLSAGLSGDEGYTGGFALSLAGQRATEYHWSLDPALEGLERASGWKSLYADKPHTTRYSWQTGTVAFTPNEIEISVSIPDDRPYAGLVFISNTRQVRLKHRAVTYVSSITLGALGTDIPETIQNRLHDIADDEKARGWGNQISDGGEPTFLWELQRGQTHWSRRSAEHSDSELNSVFGASVGYSTQVSAGVTGRWGQFTRPWWSFNSAQSEFINLGAPSGGPASGEFYLWAGAHVRYQFYDAFLEGQFRDSEVTYDRSEQLNSGLWELNVGATWGMPNGYGLTLALRAVENQMAHGKASEAWGSLILSRTF